MMRKDDAVKEFVEKWKFSEETAKLGIRAGFRCEYCLRDLLASVDDYSAWEVDHIIPKSKAESQEAFNSFENKAIACRTCNTIKSDRILDDCPVGATREELVKAWRLWISDWRARKQMEIANVRLIAASVIRSPENQ
jgi:5-methylcytosine-specific restriction endonuclease McrA